MLVGGRRYCGVPFAKLVVVVDETRRYVEHSMNNMSHGRASRRANVIW